MSEEWKDGVQVGMEHRIQETEYDAQIFTHLKMPRNADSNLHEEKFRHPLLQNDCFDKQICCSGEYERHKQKVSGKNKKLNQ